MNPRMWAFDLEMNKPTNTIIQIGGCIGNIKTGEVLERFSYDIFTYEDIAPFITQLTGITPNRVLRGVPLEFAWSEIKRKLDKWHVTPMPIVWGGGDLRTLKAQTENVSINTELNIKNISQFLQMTLGKTTRGGLETMLEVYGLKFEGRPHDAGDDGYNTFRIAHLLFKNVGFNVRSN